MLGLTCPGRWSCAARFSRNRLQRAGRREPLGVKDQPGELAEHVVVAVVVEHTRTVDVGARSDQQVRWGRAAMVTATRELALSVKCRVLDLSIYPQTRQLQKVGKQLRMIGGAARRPPSFEQKRRADRDLAILEHARDLGATILRECR